MTDEEHLRNIEQDMRVLQERLLARRDENSKDLADLAFAIHSIAIIIRNMRRNPCEPS